jgi:polyisoprenyl-teichoic acid--peptidoglycan teichoic acid transferase
MVPPPEKGSGKSESRSTSKKPAEPEQPTEVEPSDETADYELGEDFPADLDGEEEEAREDEELEDEELEDEELEDEELEDEELEDEEQLDEEEELEELVNAETQEWDGLPSGSEEEEQTLAGAAGTRIQRARSKITSGFEAVGGEKVTKGFRALGRHIRFPLWARFLTASLVIILSVGTATAASLLLYLEDIGLRLEHGGALKSLGPDLSSVEGGAPQTILILGSDKRPEDEGSFKGLSDTTMLLRVDPDQNAIALFSLPRDLKVEIPGYGSAKLNEAYANGGPGLTLKTIKQLTGLEINHLVNVDFEGFARAVNAIGCVYVDVDRRYYHSNLETVEQYEEIDIQPGYQALCGFDALDYARYRHTDNDVVRAARQQEFLREARQKVPPEVLFADRKELIDIFTEHTTSDIDSAPEMLQVLKLFIEARNAPLREVHFEGTLGPSFVTTTGQEVQKAVNQFLGIEATPGPPGESAAPEEPVAPEQAPDQTGATPAAKGKKKEKSGGGEPAELVKTDFGLQLAKAIRARTPKLPIYYPTVLEVGTEFAQKPRVYRINGSVERDQDTVPVGERAAYKWVFSRPVLGEYYGFMATRWSDPPILDNPSEVREIDGREYKLFYDGDRLRMVAWQTDEGSFWVSNTLIQSLSDREMIDIAKGMTELGKPGD